MGYSVLQTNHDKSSSTIASLAFPGAVTAGSLLVMAISYDAGQTINAVSGGGTWARVGTSQLDSGDGQRAEWWYCQNATGGATTVSWTTAGGPDPSGAAVVIAEISAVATAPALDAQDTTKAFAAGSTTADANTSNNITPAGSGELLLSAIYDQSGDAPTFTAGTGWTLAIAEPGTAGVTGAVALEWKTGGSGAQNAAWTTNQTGTITVEIAAFLPLAAPASPSAPAPQTRIPNARVGPQALRHAFRRAVWPQTAVSAGGTTYTKTGAVVVDASNLAGGDAAEHAETGLVISDSVASGADAATHAETGAIVSALQPSGADVATHAETGAVVADIDPSGGDATTHAETGLVVSDADLAGADASAHAETGAVISDIDLSGASAKSSAGKAGSIISDADLAGGDASTHSETGLVVSAAAASAGDATTHAETGIVFSDFAAAGADVAVHAETGLIVSSAVLAGGKASTHAETGSITSALALLGPSAKSTVGATVQGRVTLAARPFATVVLLARLYATITLASRPAAKAMVGDRPD